MGQITPDVSVRNILFDLCTTGAQMQGWVMSFGLTLFQLLRRQWSFFCLFYRPQTSVDFHAVFFGLDYSLTISFVSEKSIDTLFTPDPAITPPACVAADVFCAYCKPRLGLLSGGWSNSKSKGEERPPAGSELHRCDLSSQINARQRRLLPPALPPTASGHQSWKKKKLGLFFFETATYSPAALTAQPCRLP